MDAPLKASARYDGCAHRSRHGFRGSARPVAVRSGLYREHTADPPHRRLPRWDLKLRAQQPRTSVALGLLSGTLEIPLGMQKGPPVRYKRT